MTMNYLRKIDRTKVIFDFLVRRREKGAYDDEIERLLKSDTLWYCGECMSCRPRCPRGNTPGYVIQALRTLSQKLGFFVESEKGRQQIALKRVIGHNILNTGYCLTPNLVAPDLHPEQGPVWAWIYKNNMEIYPQFSDVYNKEGAGCLRKMAQNDLDEIHRIFEGTGGAHTAAMLLTAYSRRWMMIATLGRDTVEEETVRIPKTPRHEEIVVRLPKNHRGRPFLLCPQLHPSEFLSG